MSNLNFLHSGGNKVIISAPDSNPSSDVTLKLPQADGSKNQALSTNGSGVLSFATVSDYSHRRINVNGAMAIAQKGTSATGNADNGYPICTDMVNYRRTGAWSGTTWTVSQNSQTPTTLAPFQFFTRWTQAGTAQNAPNDTSTNLQYKIEGQDMAHAMWGTSNAIQCTLSFYVRCSQTGTFCVYVNSTNRYYVFEYTISAANTWQRVTHTFVSPTSGTFNTNTNAGIGMQFVIAAHAASSTYGGATTNTWLTVSKRWTSNQSTAMSANAGATWDITGIQFEIGDTATPFEHRSFGEELLRCQRYYQKSYNHSVVPGTATYIGCSRGESINANTIDICPRFKVDMRTTPTVTIYSPTDGASGNCYFDHSTNANRTAVAANVGESGFGSLHRSAGDLAHNGHQHASCQWTAAAEL